jgi:hypothetical protein
MIKEITLPSGKTIMWNWKETDTIEKVKFHLFGVMCSSTKDIIIGKCDKCGSDIKLEDIKNYT